MRCPCCAITPCIKCLRGCTRGCLPSFLAVSFSASWPADYYAPLNLCGGFPHPAFSASGTLTLSLNAFDATLPCYGYSFAYNASNGPLNGVTTSLPIRNFNLLLTTDATNVSGPTIRFRVDLAFGSLFRCELDENGYPIGPPIVFGYANPNPPGTGPYAIQWSNYAFFDQGYNIIPHPEDVANEFCFRSGSGTLAYQTFADVNDDTYFTPIQCGSIEIIDAY